MRYQCGCRLTLRVDVQAACTMQRRLRLRGSAISMTSYWALWSSSRSIRGDPDNPWQVTWVLSSAGWACTCVLCWIFGSSQRSGLDLNSISSLCWAGS